MQCYLKTNNYQNRDDEATKHGAYINKQVNYHSTEVELVGKRNV